MVKDIVIPDIGESVESGQVVGILVKIGDKIEVDQAIIEVETDKAVVEIPSPLAGKITAVLVKESDEVKIGQAIAKIDTADSGSEKSEKPKDKSTKPETEPEKDTDSKPEETVAAAEKVEELKPPEPEPPAPTVVPPATKDKDRLLPPAAPSVRRLARELGADIYQITGSGPGGRITIDDVKKYVKQVMTSGGPVASAAVTTTPRLPDFGKWGEIQREDISKVRSIIAENMALAWHTVPHVTQFDKADITILDDFRKKYAKEVDEAGGKLTVTTILLKVITAALQRFPRFNASLDMDKGEIIYKKYYHLAIAVDTDRGLLVPVIRDVDKKSIKELAIELTDMAERTRNKKIKPDELEGGTFTVSNQGGIGGTNFTPIVYWPQVAIMGISRASMEPRYIDDKPVPRLIMPLSLSYDHRIIDGADAARFLRWVVEALENPLLLNLDHE